ncbi:hypothetical protein ACHAQJ_003739 [Trichoderma viride]
MRSASKYCLYFLQAWSIEHAQLDPRLGSEGAAHARSNFEAIGRRVWPAATISSIAKTRALTVAVTAQADHVQLLFCYVHRTAADAIIRALLEALGPLSHLLANRT